MKNRNFGFVSLLAVIGVSIVFGMLLGGRLNAPRVTFAAPASAPLQLAPAVTSGGVTSFADIVENSMPAVVSVRSTNLAGEGEEEGDEQSPEWFFRRFFGDPEERDPRQPPGHPRIGEGSGFIISEEGYLLTNNHVVEGADDITIGMQDGREYKASVVGKDPSIDLALLKVDSKGAPLPTLPLGDSEALRVGEWVIAIGNPLEFEQTVTVGVLSAKERRVQIGQTDSGVVSFLQTDAAINFGNSGGPLLDVDGNVVGINTAIARQNLAEGIGFALPINQARRVIDQLRDFGEVRRGYIGINMNIAGIDRDAQEYLGLPDRNGVIIDSVATDSPAERAGLRPFDVIREVDGDLIEDNDELIAKISGYMPGEKVDLEVFREGRTLRMQATLGERPLQNEFQPAAAIESPEPDEPKESKGLGITVQALDRRVRERFELSSSLEGVMITEVEFDSLAAEKGVLPLRIVTHVNGQSIDSVDAWDEAIGRLRPGQPVKIDCVVPGPNGGFQTFFLRAP